MKFKEQVKIELIRAGLKQYELCTMLGISESTLGRMLRNDELSQDEKVHILATIHCGGAKHGEK